MFGLYVGNSSACISMLKDGEVQVLVNDVGSRVTSSSVEILDNERVVGASAKAGPNNSGNVIFQSKMYMSPERVALNKIEGYCPVTMDDGEFKYVVDFGSKTVNVTPKEVASEIFRYLYKIASSAAQGSGDVNAILTVPYYFSQIAKAEFYEAAVSGGFKILQVISDPAAAILAYDCLAVDDTPRKILVYRVGGTSIDVSVGIVLGGMLQIVKSVYEPGVGGNSLSAAIFEYLARDVEMRMQFNPLENARCRMKLYKLAEHCKHILSTNSSTTCCLETFYNGMDYSHTVTRSRIESLISSIITQLTRPVNEILEALSMKPDDIDKVILCGGTLKIPKLQKYFKELFANSEILSTIPPDEVIAVGAAKQGNFHIESLSAPYSMVQKDVLRLETSIYCKVKTADDFDCVLPKDTLLPATVFKNLTIQSEMEKTVVEFHSCEDGIFSFLKEMAIAKVNQTKEIVLEITVDGEGVLGCKLCK